VTFGYEPEAGVLEAKKKGRKEQNKKWDLGESNPVLLLNPILQSVIESNDAPYTRSPSPTLTTSSIRTPPPTCFN
jgi:hypothetical protein